MVQLVSFRDDGRSAFGALVAGGIAEISPGADVPYDSVWAALQDDAGLSRLAAAAAGREATHEIDAVELLPPVAQPTKILCAGVNYATHLAEAQRTVADHPTVFTRYFDSQVGHRGPLLRPSNTTSFDYEGELAVVIGAACFRVEAADAMAFVAGYSCYDDGTARDWQRHTSQWGPGKNFPSTGAFGPALVTADEVDDLEALELTTRVNGDVRQHASLSSLVFSVPELIAYISGFTPLAPGDVIVTGTPGGVGLFMDPPQLLVHGDVVEVEITGLGTLVNTVVDE